VEAGQLVAVTLWVLLAAGVLALTAVRFLLYK
jgi:hypothetical protein